MLTCSNKPIPYLRLNRPRTTSFLVVELRSWLLATFISLTVSINLFGQTYADEKFYLIDSLELTDLSDVDQHLLDSCLKVYHGSAKNTVKSRVMSYFVQEGHNSKIQLRYNRWLLNYLESVLANSTGEVEVYAELQELYATCLSNVGVEHWMKGENEQALSFYNRSMKLGEEIGDEKVVAQNFNNIGLLYKHQGEMDTALFYYQESLAIRDRIGDTLGQLESLNNLGLLNKQLGEVENALVYYTKALEFADKLGNDGGAATLLNNIGTIYKQQSNYPKALEFHFKSLGLREKIGDKRGIAGSLHNIGAICRQQDEIPEALDYYGRSLAINEEIGNKRGISQTLINMGLIYKHTGDLSKAREFYLRALDINEQLKSKKGVANTYNHIGAVYFEQGNFDQALEYYSKALAIFEEIGDKKGTYQSNHNIGSVYQENGQYNKAIDFGNKALVLAKELDHVVGIRSASELLYLSYKKTGDDHKALVMHEQFVEMRDSILSEENQKELLRQSFTHEADKKEKEIDLLNTEKELNRAELKSKNAQRNLFIGLTMAAIVLLLVGGFLFARIRTKNQQIELALNEKGVLLKEIHHRVKNNLQMISSLLGLQSRYTSDETASKALKESQGRVTSVSLIHQRLYSETNLTGVFMPEYVQELTEELLYSANADDMEVSLNIDDLNLDIDTVIPLGLILNELITNVIKYGRKDTGALNVSLKEEDGILSLTVSDRGLGFPTDFNPKITNSYGMKLIRSLSDKLKADTSFTNLNDGGAQVRIDIRKYKLAT